MRSNRGLAFLLLFMMMAFPISANPWVKVAKNPEEGWRLLVDGQPMAIHGVVWSFTPIGENYSYSLWDQPKDFIQKMMDRDGALMQEMGVNSIRVFADVPPEWITYLFHRYGIYSIVNPLMGRYGITVDGRWYPKTNYADLRAREAILKDLAKSIQPYVGVPGVLFYMLGNEGNYGLEWDSDEIEDLPVGQRLEVRAGYLYSLLEEGIQIIKDIDPTKPVGIVNGDIQYLNLIDTLVPSLDILGVNTYRGDASQELFYQSIAETLDVPVVYTEFGADAYNAAEEREDQFNQALYLKSQWEEIYRQSYGKGGYQNTLGGFVFQWMDEWWKAFQVENLDIHDTHASWANGAYIYDSVPGENNMNEEWWGIVAQSTVKKDGIHERRPRAAYFVLKEIWELNQIESTPEEITEHFSMDIRPFVNQAKIAAVVQNRKERFSANFRGEVGFAVLSSFSDVDVADRTFDGVSTSVGEWAYLGTDLMPLQDVYLGLTLRLQGHSLQTDFELEAQSLDVRAFEASGEIAESRTNVSNVEIYDAYLEWETRFSDIDFYYHNGHTDWAAEGDYFHLLPESFDFVGMDIDDSKAPFGLEFTGKEFLEGLKIYGGPEIYWGADPQIMGKYYRNGDLLSFSLMYVEEFSRTQSTQANPLPSGRRASGWLGLNLLPWFTLDMGVLFSGSQFYGDEYNHVYFDPSTGDYATEKRQIHVLDTLSGKVSLTSQIFLYTTLFAEYTYAGRVASSHVYFRRNGSQIPDVGTGNRHEVQAGLQFQYGWLSITPRVLVRIPLSYPRSLVSDPPRLAQFNPVAVWGSRESYQVELVLAMDPTGDTYFFDWNNAERENARIAGYVSVLYSILEGPTDAHYYKNANGLFESFPAGLPAVSGLWSLTGRLVWNAAPGIRFLAGLKGGMGQSWGSDTRLVHYWGGDLTLRAWKWAISGSIDVNGWGPADWMRQLNLTFPLQWSLDISHGFEIPSVLSTDNRLGVQWRGRTYNEFSPEDQTLAGEKWRMEVLAYLTLSW
ncbi:MAG: hypothetical protein MI717_00920 [Spirochaetales bacterium]|nr:hypothetical protein [Spirochaetales bacterium]